MSHPLPAKNKISKDAVRAHFRNLLLQQQPSLDPQIQKQLGVHLQDFMSKQKGCWGAFQPLAQEPQWTQIQSVVPHLSWAFPRVNGNELEFFQNSKKFNPGTFEISEPVDGVQVPISQLDGCLLPGLAFSKSGIRLGRGRGFYDRALANYTGLRVGLCFSIQFLEEDLPCEPHDLNVQHIVTEKGVFDVH